MCQGNESFSGDFIQFQYGTVQSFHFLEISQRYSPIPAHQKLTGILFVITDQFIKYCVNGDGKVYSQPC